MTLKLKGVILLGMGAMYEAKDDPREKWKRVEEKRESFAENNSRMTEVREQEKKGRRSIIREEVRAKAKERVEKLKKEEEEYLKLDKALRSYERKRLKKIASYILMYVVSGDENYRKKFEKFIQLMQKSETLVDVNSNIYKVYQLYKRANDVRKLIENR